MTKQRDVTRTTSTKEEDEAGKVLPEDQFGEIANTSEGRIGLKTGPISEMRRLVNAFLGLGNLNTDDKDDLDPLGAHIKNANTVDRGSPPEDNDNEGGDGDQKTDRETLGKKGKGPARVKESMAVANGRADKLVGHVEETCRALARPNLDPLNLEIAIRIHLLINVFLSRCAPVGEKPSVCRPILAAELPRSWIRVLGRLVMALEASLKAAAKAPVSTELDDECADALATILFCAGLLLDAASVAKISRAVVAQLEGVNASLANSAGIVLAGRPTAEAAVRQRLPILMAKHPLLPVKNKQSEGATPSTIRASSSKKR